MRLFSRLFTAIFVASLVLPAALAGPALAATATKLVFVGLPTNVTAGVDTVITVAAEDGSSAVDTGYAGEVTLTTDDPLDVVSPSHTYALGDNGTFDFHVTFHTAVPRNLTATDGSITAATGSLTVLVGTASHLAFTTTPVGTGGVAFSTQPAVQIEDAGNNPVADSGVTITVAIGTAPGSGVLSGTPTQVTDSSGLATFTNLKIDKAGVGYTLTASAPGPITGTSDPFSVTAGPATHLAFGTQPASGTVQGIAFTPAITVQLLDAGGNLATGDVTPVALAFTNPSSATLSGTLSVSTVGGVATFLDISINFAGSYTLTATHNSLTVDSSPFSIALQPNHSPSGSDKFVTTNEDTAYVFTTGDFGFSDVSDVPPNGFQAVRVATLPAAGTLLHNGVPVSAGAFISATDITGGLFTFAPAANANGNSYASFTFQVQDSGLATGEGNLDLSPNTITINVNAIDDAPVAAADSVIVKQGQSVTTTVVTGVLANDTDIDTAHAALTAVLDTPPAFGTVTLNSNGSYTYAPVASYMGNDSFTYHAFDGALASNVATVSIKVYINHPPIAASDIASVISGSPATVIDVLVNDYQINPDPGETLVITGVGHPTHGTAAVANGGAAVSYRPSSTFTGTDIFTYTVSDGQFSTSTSVLVHVPKDKVRPTATAPVQTIGGQTLGTKTVVVRLAWTGADVGSGVARYELQQKMNSGGYTPVKLPSALSRSSSRSLTLGASYQFRVRAVDKRGNTGAWAYGSKFKVNLLQETSATFAGAWAVGTNSNFSGRKERTTSSAGSSATFTTTGRTVAWLGVRGKTRGLAQVYVDGVFVQTVNLAMSSTKYRYVAFSRTFPSSAVHTIQIVFSDAATRLIDVDGFIVLR